MKRFVAIALAGTALIAAAPAAKNWAATAVTSPSGSYVIGNPAAKTRLVEYLSYTCSHCADFVGQASPVLKRDYVTPGRTSIEVRHAIRDKMDYAAALLARCDGPGKFMGHSEAIFAAQGDWMTKGIFFESTNAAKLNTMATTPALIAIARGSGLDALMRGRGMTPQRVVACLSNPGQQKLIDAQATEAWDTRRISGTPSFAINGAIVPDAASWGALKPRLDAALK